MSFDTKDLFEKLDMYSIRLGLESTRELAHLAGNPERDLRFIHIAGTNGKGSTAAMLERALRGAGLKTGLYTSPHLIDIRERFRVNGKSIDQESFDRYGEELFKISGMRFSYFEFATILALRIFKAEKCDVVVWETGLGGRLDATNIVTPELCIITNIALDHVSHLGNTTALIAGEKAGILKPGIPLVHGKLPDDAKDVIYAKAAELGVAVHPCREDVPSSARIVAGNDVPLQEFTYDNRKIRLALPGRMQRENFRIVYEALDLLSKSWHFDFDTAIASLEHVRWPGRFQKIGDRIILDGGHNPDGTEALAASLSELYPGERFTTVYAAFADKNAQECVNNLSHFTDHFIFTSPGTWNRESFTPDKLMEFAANNNVSSEGCPDPLEAVKLALELPSTRRIIISGSLYLAGEVLQTSLPPEETLDL